MSKLTRNFLKEGWSHKIKIWMPTFLQVPACWLKTKIMKRFISLLIVSTVLQWPVSVLAQDTLPYYLKDRGTGLATSMFGTYINRGEFIVYPFYEYYHDRDAEYAPNELGGLSDTDYRGKFRGHEFLLFLGYGISDRLAIELDGAQHFTEEGMKYDAERTMYLNR